MSWRDQYQTGSFRGVPFRTSQSEREGGRRAETHEYPRRDKPWSEDLGRAAARFRVECWVAGDDYFEARDALIEALDAEGAGTLIHPFHGTHSVVCTNFTCVESNDEGGVARFSIEFVESGERVEQPASADTGGASTEAAEAAIAEAAPEFADRFDVGGVASFVEDAATELVRATATVAQIAGSLQGGAGGVLRAFEAGLTFLPANALALVRAPLALASAVIGLVQSVSALGGTLFGRVAGLGMLIEFGKDLPPVVASTPARARQRDNEAAYRDLVATTAAAELVRVIAQAPLASYAEAVLLRDQTVALIEARIVAAADAGNDRVARRYEQLLSVMVADITARGGSLARVYAHVPAETEAALVIANRLYGADAALVDRATDIVARNALAHPGFVPGGRSIEVLEARSG